MDETYLRLAGQWVYLYRVIDQHGQVMTFWPRRSGPLDEARCRALVTALD